MSLAGLGVLALALFYILRRNKRRGKPFKPASELDTGLDSHTERKMPFLDGNPVHEVEGEYPELGDEHNIPLQPRYEMEAPSVR